MKVPIQIADNNWEGLPIYDEGHLANLGKMAEKPIAQMNLDDHPNLLIFPQDFKEYGDKIGEQRVFEVKGDMLCTGNIMGFIGYRDTKVRIYSRFAQGTDDYFLHYMLQRVLAINLFDLKYNANDESIFDFLIYLFPTFLKRALRQGLYKEYQTRHYNDANVKGRIDVSRHIRQNIPFAGNVAYTTREYAYDNHVTQLIRHTIEYITRHPMNGGILQNDILTKDAVSQIREATPTYNQHERNKVIGQNIRSLSHPYFDEYRNLQRLCMQILRQEEMKYGQDEDEIYGVLFDGAWLWEEYLNTFLADMGFEHPRNKEGAGHKCLFKDHSGWCYPDFLNQQMVLDAKYKGFDDWKKVQEKDLYQVISYMHILNLKRGGFVVPTKWNAPKLPHKELNGIGGLMFVLGMNVSPFAETFSDYQHCMALEEQKLMNEISGMANKSMDNIRFNSEEIKKVI